MQTIIQLDPSLTLVAICASLLPQAMPLYKIWQLQLRRDADDEHLPPPLGLFNAPEFTVIESVGFPLYYSC
jgi:hypothetical protein